MCKVKLVVGLVVLMSVAFSVGCNGKPEKSSERAVNGSVPSEPAQPKKPQGHVTFGVWEASDEDFEDLLNGEPQKSEPKGCSSTQQIAAEDESEVVLLTSGYRISEAVENDADPCEELQRVLGKEEKLQEFVFSEESAKLGRPLAVCLDRNPSKQLKAWYHIEQNLDQVSEEVQNRLIDAMESDCHQLDGDLVQVGMKSKSISTQPNSTHGNAFVRWFKAVLKVFSWNTNR